MISKLSPASAATISAISGVMLPASFRTGTTTETAGGAALADVSLMLCPGFVRGDELAGHPLDAPERWPREWPNAAVGIEPEGEPARGNQSRTRSAPATPTTAPTTTSLGKCAVSTTRLTAMATA